MVESRERDAETCCVVRPPSAVLLRRTGGACSAREACRAAERISSRHSPGVCRKGWRSSRFSKSSVLMAKTSTPAPSSPHVTHVTHETHVTHAIHVTTAALSPSASPVLWCQSRSFDFVIERTQPLAQFVYAITVSAGGRVQGN